MRTNRPAIPVVALTVVWLAGLALPELHLALLYLAPALLLALMLLAGRYPGERVLQRFCGTRRSPGRAVALRVRANVVVRVARRGGLLLASGLAGRAPPSASL